MLSVTQHQQNANLNRDITSHLSERLLPSRQDIMWSEGRPGAVLGGTKSVQPLWKTVWRFINKLKIELPYDPASSLLGICPQGVEADYQRDARFRVYCGSIHNSEAALHRNNLSGCRLIMGKDARNVIQPPRKNEVLPYVTTWLDSEGTLQR